MSVCIDIYFFFFFLVVFSFNQHNRKIQLVGSKESISQAQVRTWENWEKSDISPLSADRIFFTVNISTLGIRIVHKGIQFLFFISKLLLPNKRANGSIDRCRSGAEFFSFLSLFFDSQFVEGIQQRPRHGNKFHQISQFLGSRWVFFSSFSRISFCARLDIRPSCLSSDHCRFSTCVNLPTFDRKLRLLCPIYAVHHVQYGWKNDVSKSVEISNVQKWPLFGPANEWVRIVFGSLKSSRYGCVSAKCLVCDVPYIIIASIRIYRHA